LQELYVSGASIQSLWIGKRLSTMERLSISSFLHHGHDYHLFAYEPVEGLPEGVTVEDARAILPQSMIFTYREFESYAGFANYFRYKLLYERGGWWVDTDAVCLQPFEFEEPYVFASEPSSSGDVATSSFMKAPAGSPAFSFAWEYCRARAPGELSWGETGPSLVAQLVSSFSLQSFQHPSEVFCPLGYVDWKQVTDPDATPHFGGTTRAVHLWHELWRREAWDKDRDYPPACLYETWKRRYLGNAGRSPIGCRS
jgi:hypothetical protein